MPEPHDKLIPAPEITTATEYKKTHLVSLMRHDYTLAEIKSMTTLMFLASRQLIKDKERRVFSAHISDISRISGVKYTHEALKDIIRELQKKPVTLDFIGKHGA